MQQIYRRTDILHCDFNKVALELYWNNTSAWVSPVNLLHIFRTPFEQNTYRGLLLNLAYMLLLVLQCFIESEIKLLIYLDFTISLRKAKFLTLASHIKYIQCQYYYSNLFCFQMCDMYISKVSHCRFYLVIVSSCWFFHIWAEFFFCLLL